MQREYQKWLDDNKVNNILDSILEDLLRERPRDVLSGIARSCARIKRTGQYTRTLQRVQSTVSIKPPRSRGASPPSAGHSSD